MPENSSSGNGGYTYKSSGINSQFCIIHAVYTSISSNLNKGNHYCARDYGSSAANSNSYHYSNSNGSYYYSNPNGSTYYNNGQGSATYTPPSGKK
ncbi:hypothetical protein TEQG_08821 [Trichophyton equinum CBS 127.97]|uniref:Uncharacterized protein n=1 Tax=Trichophyton equinum (strain ATCC MYA-4606 / CBS 127.97) TaxID=559882 RepID=F2Q426_TRIEC|nr:hypothetical protein TEQG_08821 [Trichophyton equinum CBS 127.97]